MKESEIRPQQLMDEYLHLARQDVPIYFANTAVREHIPCPACANPESSFSFAKIGFDYRGCSDCNTLFLSPRPLLSQFVDFYENSPSSTFWANVFFPAVAEARRNKIFIPRVHKIKELCRQHSFSPKTIIDVGAGHGMFLEEFKRCSDVPLRLCAVEPGFALAEICRDKGFEVLEKIVEDASEWRGIADLVTCFEVIEHAHNPLEFIRSLMALLKPGGYLLVSGLNVEGFDIQLLWEQSKSISPPHHINFLSVSGFQQLFGRAGLQNVEVLTPGRLDVDIVLNMLASGHAISMSRFEKTLLSRGSDTHAAFQQFLSECQLSSHCFIWGRNDYIAS